MTRYKDDINAKIDEYHLMIEEVLGGMDMMISRLEARVNNIEEVLGIDKDKGVDTYRLESLTQDLEKLKIEVTEGFNLAFRKIAEK